MTQQLLFFCAIYVYRNAITAEMLELQIYFLYSFV